MSNPFTPNARGLVVVTMLKHYGSNVAGDKAGFLPEIAKDLVKKGAATLPGMEPAKSEAPADDGVEVTTRKFRPSERPGGLDKLRDEYKAATGEDASARWGEARLKAEIAKAKDAKSEAPADAGA
jgi:hypothetical protein